MSPETQTIIPRSKLLVDLQMLIKKCLQVVLPFKPL